MKRKKPKIKILFFFVLILLLLGLGEVYSLLKNLPKPDRITERSIIESTKIYDRSGSVLLYEIHGEEKRTVVPLGSIPKDIKSATLTAEDINFYSHSGIDWQGIMRAIISNLKSGRLAQGGSTITQQLIKSSLLTPEKTFSRKIREQILAILVEKKYSKDEILEMYLNQVPYGSNAYGVESAARTFFGKGVTDLNLNESAVLAAMTKAPSYYSPYGPNKEELYNRKNKILDRMAEAGFASKEETDQAKKSVLVFQPVKSSILAPHFVMYVRGLLNDKFGEDFVEKGGLKVITTLDWNLQQEAEKIVKEGTERNKKNFGAYNASLVAINPNNGEILAMVGSRSYWEKSEPDGCVPGVDCLFDPHVNIATRLRQPGSAFKPFAYATAFSKGYTPDTVLFDVSTEFNPKCNPNGSQEYAHDMQFGPCYSPRNYDDKFRGPVTLRQAISQSLNVPSVKVLYLAGIRDTIKMAQGLGITSLTEPEKYGLSLVLGGAEVSLLEMTSAFGVFAKEGFLSPKNSILRIENSNGNILEEKKEESIPVLDSETAKILNDVLSDNEARQPMFHPNNSLHFPDRQIAAKTGTTQDARDAWVVGYSPTLSVGVWAGNNNNAPMNKSAVSVSVSGPIWHKFLEFALKSSPPEEFSKPDKKISEKPILRGIYRDEQIIKIDKSTRKLATIFTPQDLIEEIGIGNIKSILSKLKKDDPLGPIPSNPEEDFQFNNWQWSIDNWLTKNPLTETAIPKDFDNIHSIENTPKIFLIYPDLDKTLDNLDKISLKIDSKFPLKEVLVFIDDELISSQSSIIGKNLDFIISKKLSKGGYEIRIIVYDTMGNKNTLQKEFKTAE